MKTILIFMAVVSIMIAAGLGTLVIFEVYTLDQGISFAVKAYAAIILLGGSSVLISYLIKDKEAPKD